MLSPRQAINHYAVSIGLANKLIMMVGLVAIGNGAGCSLDSGDSLASVQNSATQFSGVLAKATSVSESDTATVLEHPSGKQIAKSEVPSPGRINAFELSGEFHAETPNSESRGKREIYVIGFVDVDNPSVMLAIDGRTQVFKTGDTFERITVQEIVPPRARLSCDGVTWQASIFDRRSTPNEVSAPKK